MENTPLSTDSDLTSMDITENETNNIHTTTENLAVNCIYEYPQLFKSKTLIELCTSSWCRSRKAKEDVQPYLRGCKWSPDGTCCLCVVNNDGAHLLELPRDLYADVPSPNRTIDILDSVVHIKEAGLVYDYCWYPGMNSTIPESCWFVFLDLLADLYELCTSHN